MGYSIDFLLIFFTFVLCISLLNTYQTYCFCMIA